MTSFKKTPIVIALVTAIFVAPVSPSQEVSKWMADSVEAAPADNAKQKCYRGLLDISYSSDRNDDGEFTISDVYRIGRDVASLPADLWVVWSYGTDFGNFFEIRCKAISPSGLFLSFLLFLGVVSSMLHSLRQYLRERGARRYIEKKRKLGYGDPE